MANFLRVIFMTFALLGLAACFHMPKGASHPNYHGESVTAIEVHKADRKMFLQKYKLDDLPLILHTDPVVRFLGLQDNDIVKITRPDFVAGQYIMYRRVVSGSVNFVGSDNVILDE